MSDAWENVEVGDTVTFQEVTRTVTYIEKYGDIVLAKWEGGPEGVAGLIADDEVNPIKCVSKPDRDDVAATAARLSNGYSIVVEMPDGQMIGGYVSDEVLKASKL